MKLITIFNFPKEENYINLCAWWLHQARKYAVDLNIEIWHNQTEDYPIRWPESNGKEKSVTHIPKNTFDLKDYNDRIEWDSKALHNIGFKLYNLCRETEPFIFVDADAIIFEDLSHLVECSKDQPVIMVNHEKVEGHTAQIPFSFLNSGVQVVSDPSLLDFEKILSVFEEHGSNYIIPGTDQALLYQYFKHIGYDYTHPKVGHEWNHCAGLQSKNYLLNPYNKVSRPTMPESVFLPVCINHYWYDFKPWQIDCPFFKEFQNGN